MTDKARILFVDDEKRVLNAMRGLFRRDYELYLASEGAEAVRIAAKHDVDVIVADQRMPGMTGIEVLGKIKQQSPRTVRILLTGYADPSAVEGSINIGEVFRFLSKPCPPQLLRDTLTQAVDAARTAPVADTAPALPDPVVPAKPAAPVHKPTVAAAAPLPAALPVASAPMPAPAMAQALENDDTHPALPTLQEDAIKVSVDDSIENTSDNSSSHRQTVTNVVLSEDNVEETQENVALTSATLGVNDVGVVVFTVDSEFAAVAIRSCTPERDVVLATTLVKVAQAIDKHNAGVLVTDFTTNSAILQKIIGALKQHMPELVTIVVSNGRDTTDMIGLINYGQVFRYVLKPIEPEQLRSDIHAAVIRHLYLLNNPESMQRHQVIGSPTTTEGTNTVNEFIGNLGRRPKRQTDPSDTLT